MKHIFVVHSNITYLSALGIIIAERLDLSDCTLVSEGVFMRQEPVPTVAIPYFRGLKACGYNPLQYLSPSRAIDRRLSELTLGEPFTAYLATMGRLARHTISHPRCAEFHFMEEGLLSYVTSFSIDVLTLHDSARPWRTTSLAQRFKSCFLPFFRAYSPRLAALPLFYNAYPSPRRKFYGYTAQSHTLIDPSSRRQISLQQVAERFTFHTTLQLANSVIWIGDCVEGTGHTVSEYLQALECGFVEQVLLKGNINTVFVKFHYRESAYSRAETLAIFARHGISITVIDDSAIMEIELMATSSAHLYGTYSSLLVYAVFTGNRASSIDRFYLPELAERRTDCIFDFIERV
ncbi:MAG: polysialyltransferase family glycosyltransferase [Mucinivorans sp.]